MNSYKLKNKRLIVSIIVGVVLIVAGVAIWLTEQPTQDNDRPIAMTRYQGKSFSIEVPRAASTSGHADKVSFILNKGKNNLSDNLEKALESAQGTFGVQVSCMERTTQVDALSKMDTSHSGGNSINGRPIMNYVKSTINSRPARTFEYENNFHKIIAATVQSEKNVCLVNTYVPKNDEATWRAVAEASINSLVIKD